VFVDLGAQHATRMRRIVICGLSGFTTFFHLIIIRRVGQAVAQLVEALRYKPEGRGFDF
jgi:hypothetical protein